jgi:energy-dependent translational throttle protein EttA
MSDHKIIFSMAGVSKIYPPSKQVLKDIYLSFFYGAKIGVLGLNGSGKSSLLRIIAGVDKNFQGEVVFDSKNYKIGFLEQEPELDENKTVLESVKEGVKHITDLLDEFENINNSLADPNLDGDEMMKILDRQAVVMEQLEQNDAWELDTKLEKAMDALRCPES